MMRWSNSDYEKMAKLAIDIYLDYDINHFPVDGYEVANKILANNSKYYVGTDKYGNKWNIKQQKDGKQLWVRYRNGKINEGGRNNSPKPWDNETGLNKNPFKKGGK